MAVIPSKESACGEEASQGTSDSNGEEVGVFSRDEFIKPSSHMAFPVAGRRIEFVDSDGQNVIGRVLGRGGKSTGKYKYSYNVEKSDGGVQCIDLLRDVKGWRHVGDDAEVLLTKDNDIIYEAKLKEYLNWKENEVFEEVKDDGQKAISVRWVITEKLKSGIPHIKSRLVARGFEENLNEEYRKDSPTCTKDSLRLCVALASAKDWLGNTLDIKSAFLQGKQIERDVYLRPPKEFDEGKLWKLKKNVYGLNDAARAWYFRLKEVLLQAGMSLCNVDPALFYYIKDATMSGLVCVHVDDLFWAGTEDFSRTVIAAIYKNFCVGSSDTASFNYVGISVKKMDKGMKLTQHDYIASMEEIKLSKQRAQERSSNLGPNGSEKYQALVGQLIWLTSQTRPDIAYDVCRLSTRCSRAKVEDVLEANKVLQKVRRNLYALFYPLLRNLNDLIIECYCDASFANLDDGGSQGAYIIFLTDRENNRSVLSWKSRKVRRVVKSTIAAETLALLDGAEAAVLFSCMVADLLNLGVNKPIVKCYVDNRSLVDALYSTKLVEDKLLRINMAVLRDMLERGDVHSVSWVQSSQQLANALTKRGACTGPLISAFGSQL